MTVQQDGLVLHKVNDVASVLVCAQTCFITWTTANKSNSTKVVVLHLREVILFSLLFPLFFKLHDGDVHAVGWGEGP